MAKAKKPTANTTGTEAPVPPGAKPAQASAPPAAALAPIAAAEAPKPGTKKAAAKKAPATAPAKAGGAKGKAGAAKPAAPGGSPLIDTNLAAQAAARMIAAKVGPAASQGERKETSTFRQLKDSLAKGHSTSVTTMLNNTTPPSAKKSSLPFGGHGGKQIGGHNQTFGSDANRNSVPRRTGGG